MYSGEGGGEGAIGGWSYEKENGGGEVKGDGGLGVGGVVVVKVVVELEVYFRV